MCLQGLGVCVSGLWVSSTEIHLGVGKRLSGGFSHVDVSIHRRDSIELPFHVFMAGESRRGGNQQTQVFSLSVWI